MNEERPVDLSVLDPMTDRGRWHAYVNATMLRVDNAIASRPQDTLTMIANWSGFLTRACLVVLALLLPIEVLLERRETGAEQIQQLVQFSMQSTVGKELPTGADLSRTLGSDR